MTQPVWDRYYYLFFLNIFYILVVFFLIYREGEEWLRRRQALNQKMLRPKEVENYAPELNNVTDDLLKKIREMRNNQNEVENIDNDLLRWSLECELVSCFLLRLIASLATAHKNHLNCLTFIISL